MDIFITILNGFEKRTGTNYRLLTKAFKREGWKILKWEKCNEKYFNLVGEIESKNNKVSNNLSIYQYPSKFYFLYFCSSIILYSFLGGGRGKIDLQKTLVVENGWFSLCMGSEGKNLGESFAWGYE